MKPEFFRHEELQSLEAQYPTQRIMLTFAGLWTQCDRYGVFIYKPRQLHLDILPFVDFEFERTLDILVENGFITKFTDGTDLYGYIPTFKKHQAISGKEQSSKFRYPEPPQKDSSSLVPDQFQSSSRRVTDSLDFMTSLHHDITTTPVESDTPKTKPAPQKPFLDSFEAFYKAYPRHVARQEGYKAYCALMRKGVAPEEVMRAVAAYKAEIARKGTEQDYIRHPATFLHNLDDYKTTPIPPSTTPVTNEIHYTEEQLEYMRMQKKGGVEFAQYQAELARKTRERKAQQEAIGGEK